VNTLYYGDNLDILRRYIKDETVDLVYLDPPFKSNQDYNVLFAEQNGSRSAAQIKAFEDTWEWNEESARVYQEIVEGGGRVSQAMQAFRRFLGDNDMLAYLAMMAPRLVELRRVLRPTGSIYLHCDPTASHYLKVLMDAVFGPGQFRNEIVWHYSGWNKILDRQFESRHDTIFFYSKQENSFSGYAIPWENEQEYIKIRKQKVHSDEEGRRFVLSDAGGGKRVRRYIDEAMELGSPVDDVWDIDKINNSSKERLGYPTQKPEALVERIIKASSKEGNTVLDPFCGCGTTIAAAERLKRSWIGIDITHLAIGLIKHRLWDAFGDGITQTYQTIGEPTSLPDATTLAAEDPYQFQSWALGLVGARSVEQKKGADKGIDGRLYFHDEPKSTKQIIFSVKAGHTNVAHVRDLRGVIDREKAQIGVLISLELPTQPMRAEAASAGFYKAPWDKDYPRLQLLTIADLLSGKTVDFPRENVTFKKAPKATEPPAQNEELQF